MESRIIDNDTAIRFLKENKAMKEGVFYRQKDVWYGLQRGTQIVAVVGYTIKKGVLTIGGLFVKKELRGKGIGQGLVNLIMLNNFDTVKNIVSYSRPVMAHILDKWGFTTVQVLKNGTKKQVWR